MHYGKCGSVESEKDPGDQVGLYAGSPLGSPLKKGKMADGSRRMNCVDIQPPPQSLLLLK